VKGYKGKIAVVDLTSRTVKEEVLSENLYRSFIGGIGLGVRILYEYMKPRVNPLGPENIIGFVTGPLAGTPAPMAAKYAVVTKSPLTNTWGDANSGGFFGSELKAAGYDAVFLTGVSSKPVYLFIKDSKIEFRDATHIWGKDTRETEVMLKQGTGERELKTACIGPAGESVSLIASIISDRSRVAARSGVGAVMGSKKLKAIAVRGTAKIEVADANMVSELRRNTLKYLRENVESLPFIKMISGNGTCDALVNLVFSGATPIKNWSFIGGEDFPQYSKMSGGAVTKYQLKRSGCGNCPINCGGILDVKEGPYATEGRKPEYETLASFGAMCLNSNIESIIKANHICDRYGIDTISAGSVIAFAMECYEKGIISKKDTEGIELTWGNAAAILSMLEKIVKREGFGDVLADGVERAAKRIGKSAEECAIHIHGQEPGMHDPRFFPQRGLGYITSATPGRHMVSQASIRFDRERKLGIYPEVQAPKEKEEGETGRMHATATSYNQVFSDSGMCLFAITAGNAYPLIEFISAVTGWDFTAAEAIKTGQRILTLCQIFNIREGWTAKDFNLPDRIKKPPTTGPFAGRSINFNALRASYYKSMGWDIEYGLPSRQCLNELGIKDLAGTFYTPSTR
jgi:aldehyde:ferredoxin oxidoreductase